LALYDDFLKPIQLFFGNIIHISIKMMKTTLLTTTSLRINIQFATIIFAILFTFASPIPSSAEKRALLVGVNKYKFHDQSILERKKEINLEGCVEDAIDIKNLLIQHLGFQESEIKLITDNQATLVGLEEAITEWLVNGTKPGDTVFFYYSGHGFLMQHPDGDYTALCPHDANPFTLENLLSANRLGELFNNLRGRALIAIIDACHSAAAMRGNIAESQRNNRARARFFPAEQIHRSAGRSRNLTLFDEVMVDKIFLAASGAKEKAWELPIEGRVRGVFTYGLVRELSASNGNIDARTLRDATAKFIANENLPQHPELKSESVLAGNKFRDLFISQPQTQLASMDDPQPPFKVEVWVTERDKKKFHLGERLVFSVKSEKGGYLYLLDVDPQKHATLLFPNYWDKNNYINPGQIATVPGLDFRSELFATEPLGLDTIIALVSDNPWPELENIQVDSQQVLATLNNLQVKQVVTGALTRNALRGVSVRQKSGEKEKIGQSSWALGKIQIEIIK
jgi:hypothetical protein